MTADTNLFRFRGDWSHQVVATAIHDGHEMRPEVAEQEALPVADRLREEDPFTGRLGSQVPDQMIARRSRFEVDLNREPENAVYARPEQSWGMEVWEDGELDEEIVDRSLDEHEEFYDALAERLDRLNERGPFLVLDVHSYNHRRTDDHSAEPQWENPDVNVGTQWLDRERWAPLVETFLATMGQHQANGRGIDVRENVKFKGANLCHWVAERYPENGAALAIEFKKTYMDEWTGQPHDDVIEDLATALGAAAAACNELLTSGKAQT